MKKETVVSYYGSQNKVASVLNVSRQYVSKWPDIVPEVCALRLERITDGKLAYDESMYRGAEGDNKS